MTTYLETDTQTWTFTGTDTCDITGCWHSPAIIAGGGWHDKFCQIHLPAAVDLALRFPTFPGWYRVESIHSPATGTTVVIVHPL